jgi:hypothetical protein
VGKSGNIDAHAVLRKIYEHEKMQACGSPYFQSDGDDTQESEKKCVMMEKSFTFSIP